jgi:hypothetical protein
MISQQVPFVSRSRLFAYFNARAAEGAEAGDNGATLRDMVSSLASNFGVCTEDIWPYDIAQVLTKPTAACYAAATPNKIRLYARLSTLNEMLLCLAAGFPFIFGFTVYEKFESEEVAQSGILSLPTLTEGMVGGHAVCAVGYDRLKNMLLVRNSWGPNGASRVISGCRSPTRRIGIVRRFLDDPALKWCAEGDLHPQGSQALDLYPLLVPAKPPAQKNWCACSDLHREPAAYEADALTLSYRH